MTVLHSEDRESGMAMITAVIVCMIVMFLGLTAVALTDHTLGTQRVDRKRITTFHAAEAGLDHALEVLQTTAIGSLPCSVPLASSVGSGPDAADYSVTFQYYNGSGSALACPLASPPATVLLTSVGDSSDPVGRRREVQLTAKLDPPANTTGLDKVIFSDGSVNFSNNVQIDGFVGNDAVVYTNHDYTCANSQQLVGAVYAQGFASLSNSCGVQGDVWANNAVTLAGSATVGRDVTSSTSSITMSNQALVRRNARAGTTITTNGSSTIQGLRIPTSPTVTPPTSAFPQVPYDETAWLAAGYTVRPYTNCALAESELKTLSATWTSPTVVRVTGCLLTISNSSTITVANHLAIVSDYGITFNNLTNWVAGGTALATTAVREIHLIVPYGSSCSGQGNISLGNNFTMPSPMRTFLYTPCVANLANNGRMLGQFYGGTVNYTNSTWIAYRPVSGVPGYAPVLSTTYVRQVSVLYKREVVAP
jgi:cytoskeletal protein CcmA (bactofilin family)